MRGSGGMQRASVNGQQFIETGIARGSGRAVTAKVATSKEVVFVDDWTPEDGDADIDHGHSIKVDMHASADTKELELLYDEDADWESGTHDDTKATGDALTLNTTPFTEDFEGVSPLDDWSTRLATGGGTYYITTDGDSKVLYVVNWNDNQCFTPDNGPDSDDQIVRVDMKFNLANINGFAGPAVRLTGSGSALRGYFFELRWNSNQIRVDRITGENSWAYVNQVSGPFYFAAGTWYTIMMKASGQGIWYKVWRTETESEPASWSWCATNSSHTTGETGIYTRSGSESSNWHFDNYAAESDPPAYAASGEWLSGVLDTRSVEHYSHALVSWDETLPALTTAAIKTRWRPEDAWAACTNGGEVPGIARGSNMEDGSPYTDLEIQVLLGTTDDSETPEIENLRVYFEPLSAEALELDLAGDFSCVVDDGSLDYWGRSQVDTGVTVLAWDDIHIQSNVGRWVKGRGAAAVIAVNYGGDRIDDITIAFARDFWMESPDFAGYYWGMTPLVYEAAPIQVRWNAAEEWTPGSHVYEWVLIDKNIAMHADAYYIVGRPQLDDHPMSWLVAAVNLHDHPLSVQPKGWMLNDHPMSMLIQGWQRDDHPLSYLPGVWTINDHPVSMLSAIEYINDHPMSLLVYGVSREGMIEVNIIDDTTWAELVALGYTRS